MTIPLWSEYHPLLSLSVVDSGKYLSIDTLIFESSFNLTKT